MGRGVSYGLNPPINAWDNAHAVSDLGGCVGSPLYLVRALFREPASRRSSGFGAVAGNANYERGGAFAAGRSGPEGFCCNRLLGGAECEGSTHADA